MSFNHGINPTKTDTRYTEVEKNLVGVPFFVGCWPVHLGKGFDENPVLVENFTQAARLGGFDNEWRTADGAPKWSLCEAAYSQFILFQQAPAVFCNVFNPNVHKKAIAGSDKNVAAHSINLGSDVIIDDGLVVKKGESVLVRGTDYEAFYEEGKAIIELIESGAAYDELSLNVAYTAVDLSAINDTVIIGAIEKIEKCKTLFGLVPDLICAPGWSQNATVAAVMAAKAACINGLYFAKAVVDLDTATATSFENVAEAKENAVAYNDANAIVCWPLAKVGDMVFNMSTIACGCIAKTDTANGDVPFESPSNKAIPINGLVLKDGTPVYLTLSEADVVSYDAGVVTAINHNGWVLWGNYTGCHPTSKDISKYFICTSRMMDFIANNFVERYWKELDRPLTSVLIESILNDFNAWLSGLTHEGKIYGGEIKYVGDENTNESLLAGCFRLDVTVASPVPAQRIDMFVEFDLDLLINSLTV